MPPPEDKNIIGNRWVFKVKRKSDGSIDRFKARLVAKGFSQEQGIDYQEVFAPVVRYDAIRSLLALANHQDLEIHQMDIKTAFLQGELDTEVYMAQPNGFIDEDKPDHVCKLQRSIYGLKQAARCWNLAMDKFLKSSGYKCSGADSCLYTKLRKEESGKISFVILALYVDDILLISNQPGLLKNEKQLLADRFDIVDQGEVHYILGMCIKRNREKRLLSISQPKYLEQILKRFQMDKCKAVSTPLEPGKRFEKLSENETAVDTQKYQMIVGCLTYVSTATRPDIAASVGILSQFMSRPGRQHWEGIKRVLRYLKGTVDCCIHTKKKVLYKDIRMPTGQEIQTHADQYLATYSRYMEI